ncbi:hypothetical protein Tco_0002003 [Tanacetum coccineum]
MVSDHSGTTLFPSGSSMCFDSLHGQLDIKAEFQPLSSDEISSRISLVKSLATIEHARLRDLKQKAKIRWAMNDDENLRFFHGMINNRSNRSQSDHSRRTYSSSLFNQLTLDKVQLLDTPFSIFEIKDVVLDCGSDKAPGPDGFTFKFLKKHRNLLEHDIIAYVKDFEATAHIPKGCNCSFITLVLKVKYLIVIALSNNDLNGTSIEGGFKRAFATLFEQDVQTFTRTMFVNLDQLEKHLSKEAFQELESSSAFRERSKKKREYDRRMNARMMQSKEGNADLSKALDAGLVVTECNETESERHVSSNISRKDTHAEDAYINSMNDKQPMAKDTYLLEKVDRNTIPKSTDMSHRGGEIDQNADAEKCQGLCPLLDPSFDNMTTEFSNQSLESENISLKKTVAHLQKYFSRMETHCVNMELKLQNQALKDGQHGQILNETSNKAKIKKEIEVLGIMNIELKHSMAKLLTENEKLHKENEHLKQTYKDLYDFIKKT